MSLLATPQVQAHLALHLPADAVTTMQRAARQTYPDEACGLLLGTISNDGSVRVRQVVVVPNVAPERARRYVIEPRVLLEWDRAAQTSGWSIVGFFHTHPNAAPRPSATDAALAWPGYVYVIVGVNGEFITGMAAWTFDESLASFTELPVRVDIAYDEIEYFI